MSETRLHARLRGLAAWSIAGVFLVASWGKIADPTGFVADIRNYRMMPWWALNGCALVMPWWELLAALALLIPSWRRAAALITGGMGLVFFISVSIALARGLDIHCGCFGHGERAAQAGLETLLLDAGVIIASWYICLGREPRGRAAFDVSPVGTEPAAMPLPHS